MRLLLDTHVLIWWDGGRRLPRAVASALKDADDVFISAASAWEVAIKSSLGKVVSTRSIAQASEESGFTELPVTFRHAEQVRALPTHHRDPFDRILIAQAQIERLTLVTHDPLFAMYDVPILRA